MRNTDSPFISIIIATFQAEATVRRCLESIARQGFLEREVIVIDGGSSDGTLNIIKKSSEVIWFLSEPDHGIYNAWNKGLARARGEWICFLGADDTFFTDDVLERMAAYLRARNADEVLFYGRLALLNVRGQVLGTVGEPWEKIQKRFLQVNCVPHTGAMHHRSMFDVGGFDERFRIAGDYELLLRELRHRNARFVPEVTTVAMQQGGISSNPENALRSLLETRRAQKKWGVAGRFPGNAWLFSWMRVLLRLSLTRVLGFERTGILLDIGRRLTGSGAFWSRL